MIVIIKKYANVRVETNSIQSINCNVNPDVNTAISILRSLFAMTDLLFEGPSHIMKLRPILNSELHIKPISTYHIPITFHIPFFYPKDSKSPNLCMIQS